MKLGNPVLIFIGIGANLTSPEYGDPRATCGAALAALVAPRAAGGITIAQRSQWYKSAPVPASDQPWFVNAVVLVKTALDPDRLIDLLLQTEQSFGRHRAEKNDPRILDLDLLAYGEMVIGGEGPGDVGGTPNPTVPHPRLHERAFVLLPLRDIAPDWRHPVLDLGIHAMIEALPPGQQTEVMADAGGAYGSEWHKSKNAARDGE
jgi:2-amino-4-hydroxy-6-hydroxymethyldihydropteridine diphosphokinase